MFLVPKPGVNKWHMIIVICELNIYCSALKRSCETLNHVCYRSRPGGYFVSLYLADRNDALGIREEERDLLTVNYRSELWRLACLAMGWS
jgi:hypothetical protein